MAVPQASTKIVFLDCDGVVSPFGGGGFFSRPHMARVKKILDATGAKIVLSSSWRMSEFGRSEVTKQLVANGMPTFMACTPNLEGRPRACEILEWVKDNKERLNIVNFVALDDINLAALAPDKPFFRKHAVCTDGKNGLTDEDAAAAIEMLRDENNF